MAIPLTPELLQKLTDAVSCGSSIEDAARSQGIHQSTLFRWIKRGRDATKARQRGAEERPEDEAFIALAEGVDTARAQARVEALTIIRRHALGMPEKVTTTTTEQRPDGKTVTTTKIVERVATHWQAAAWFLERRYPAEFALVNRMELSGPGGGPIETLEERAERLAEEATAFLAAREAAELAEEQRAEAPE